MQLVTPDFGLIFWQTLVFLVVLIVLSRLVWPQIMGALNEREKNIADALASAENAKVEMLKLKSDNEALLAEARKEKDRIVSEASATAKKIVEDARNEAQIKVKADLDDARRQIETDKQAAMADIKNLVGALSIEIATKLLKENLASDAKQSALIDTYLNDLTKN